MVFPATSPQEIQNAYGLKTLLSAGFTGSGQTIIIIDSFGSPTIANDLAAFDTAYGIPAPPSFKVLAPLGTVPFDPTNSDMVGWAFETTLDVEWAHAMAPGANIVLLTSPVSQTEGVQGLPEFLKLEQYALKNKLGMIISQSWAATENTLFSPAGENVITDFEDFYRSASLDGVTILASAGDSGSANVDVNYNVYPLPTVNFPASSPYVTAVGGTSLYADTSGNYLNETVWNNDTGATGGGVSQYFLEPLYQRVLNAYQPLLGGKRAIPDVAYNADPLTGILVYATFLPSCPGCYFFIGGTSEGSPQWAGIVADANQLAGRPLGYLNPGLYALGALNGSNTLFHDVVAGNNSFDGVPGYNAAPGWDPTTGWGTPNLPTQNLGALVRALAQPSQPFVAANTPTP
jgi:subtilase family serine protease